MEIMGFEIYAIWLIESFVFLKQPIVGVIDQTINWSNYQSTCSFSSLDH